MKNTILSPAQMNQADQLTIASGVSGAWLMENAGYAILDVVLARYPAIRRAVVLCGPGNNGGDGYVVARLLAERGVPIALYRAAPAKFEPSEFGAAKFETDAALAQARWSRPVEDLVNLKIEPGDVVIDALYGAGFRGRLEGADAAAVHLVLDSAAPVVSVDLPSGLNGLTGTHHGPCFHAAHTVTFFRKKPGHLLYPGRVLCGEIHVADIGISSRVLTAIKPALYENAPSLFASHLPRPIPEGHKYTRGGVGVFSGGAGSTGAARLSALAAAKAGAGAVTLLAPEAAVTELGCQLTSAMIETLNDPDALAPYIIDKKYAAFLIGPGFGDMPRLRDTVMALLKSTRAFGLVLDADVFTAFADDPDLLFAAIEKFSGIVVITPHDGEFERLFGDIAGSNLAKHEKALAAAARAHCIIIYKGPDSVVASPDGRAAISANGGAMLATAGSGDVLAGVVVGLIAQGMKNFEAACAAVYAHSDAGNRLGFGLMAEDLAAAISLPTM